MHGKRGAAATSIFVLAMGAVVAEGCASSSEAPPRRGSGGGAGAGTGGGGTSGKGTGARPGGGKGGSAGRPEMGGSGGSPRAGTGGGSGAGDGGSSGEPACDCTVTDFEFNCRLPLDAVSLPVPKDCEHDLNYVRRESCSGGYARYVWAEGGENDYEVFTNADDEVVYVSAIGYVSPGCDLPAGANDYGSYSAGHRPNTTCARECTVCETDGLGAGGAGPSCAVCTPLTQDRVAVSLADYCASEPCPDDLGDARDDATRSCGGNGFEADMATSCGVVTVRTTEPHRNVSYFFDADSKALTGLQVRSDAPSGPCEATHTLVGTIPAACRLESNCALCPDAAAGGASSAGGEGGGGAGGGGASGAPATLPECPAP